ncbi:hypothetical protein D8674_016092 [Pyrus ussuriensis x Pyrus communis]|uniref:Protein BIG GRAIN 1-like E n=1 Tax=Pyrus ussuriensis x Pyrus communis TaxID=2448454 RepID=A0A5N5HE68_9ROSA|nr:hypothetical protein D8674_016092 [Pyrus ussuriensis x Pyrus communis]
MSIISTGVLSADPGADKIHKKSFHHRNDSGELDVFEAARYFSGYIEAPSSHNNNNNSSNSNTSAFSQRMMKEDRSSWRGGRISLDMPIRHMLHHPQQNPNHHNHVVVEKQNNIKDKKYKQPSSPGGRLASFLNSLFNQSASKKKKSKSSATQSMKDEEESPGGRRRRRSSISHFRSSSTTDAKSVYSSSSSGFRTPPPYSHAQTAASKSYKDLRSYSDNHKQQYQQQQQQAVSLSKYNTNFDEKRSSNKELTWLDHEKFKLSEKYKISSELDHKGLLKRLSEVVDDEEEDEGAESDSSSDLFELQNYDLGFYSSGLPVYETTNVDNIKIRSGTPISNASS